MRAPGPLEGSRVVVTRPVSEAAALADRLSALGAVPLVCPMIEFGPPPDVTGFDTALATADADWVVFTSATGVRIALERAAAAGIEVPAWRHARVAAIGPATAATLSECGREADFVPDTFVGEVLADALPDVAGGRVLLIRAQDGRDVLRERLVARGADVLDVPAYTTRRAPVAVDAIERLRAGFDVVTFTAPSTVDPFVDLLRDAGDLDLASRVIVTIGPVTSAAVRAHGFDVSAEARSATLDGLVDALVAHFSSAG